MFKVERKLLQDGSKHKNFFFFESKIFRKYGGFCYNNKSAKVKKKSSGVKKNNIYIYIYRQVYMYALLLL